MTIMWLIAGLVIGLGIYVYIKREMARAKRLASFQGKLAPCPGCAANLVESGTWLRKAVLASRGDLWTCAKCGQDCGYDMDRDPPVLKETGRNRRKEPKPDPTPTPSDPTVPPAPTPTPEPKKPWWQRRRRKKKDT